MVLLVEPQFRNKLNIRNIEKRDYKYINKWWKDSDLPIPKLTALPENGLGGLIIEKEKPIAAAYIYLTNSTMGYVDYLISDPEYKSRDKYNILLELVKQCTEHCKSLGFEITWAMLENKHLVNMAIETGWKTWGGPQTVVTYKNN